MDLVYVTMQSGKEEIIERMKNLMVILISACNTLNCQILLPYVMTMLRTVSSSLAGSLSVNVGTKFKKMWLQSHLVACVRGGWNGGGALRLRGRGGALGCMLGEAYIG